MNQPTIKAAIYARYSSDLQNPRSVEDQISLCKSKAQQSLGITNFVDICTDKAISGETLERPGLIRLQELVSSGLVNLIVAEGLDRISRRNIDMQQIFELLVYYQCQLWTCQEGYVNDMLVNILGIINQTHNTTLKDKVRRGHRARALEGKMPGGLPYAYEVDRTHFDDRGHPINGMRKINEEKAKIVRRIFTEYVEGRSIKAIVRGLNNDDIPSPSGGKWASSSLKGSLARHEGILCKDIYHGVLLYNKTRKITHPTTKRVQYRANPVKDIVKVSVPELRIIPEELWEKAQARLHQDAKPRQSKSIKPLTPIIESPKRRQAVKGHPLTGLIKCAVCGGNKSIGNNGRYICSVYRYIKKCTNSRGMKEKDIYDQLSAYLIQTINESDLIADNIINHLNNENGKQKEYIQRFQEYETITNRLLTAIEKGVDLDATTQKIMKYQTEMALLKVKVNRHIIIPSPDDIKMILLNGIDEISNKFDDQTFNRPLQNLFHNIIAKLELRPIYEKRTGESLTIYLNDHGWPSFYENLLELWPHLLKQKKRPN